jgi:hypothetical protein
MADVAGFPYGELQFDKQGALFDAAALQQAMATYAQSGATDLVVLAHGWNNDMADARELYRQLLTSMRAVIDAGSVQLGARKLAVLALLWPSKKFADKDLIPSGAAAAASPVTPVVVAQQLDALRGVFDNPQADAILTEAKALVAQLESSPAARTKFADLVRSLPATRAGSLEDATDRFFKLPGDELMNRLSKPALPRPAQSSGGGAASIGAAGGQAAGIADAFSGIQSAARNLVNFTTYYQMKERAGLVGRGGARDAIERIRARLPDAKVHLVGHSFGGRLVAALALGEAGQAPATYSSLTLLQAAFSHNGFSQKFDGTHDGFFRDVVAHDRVKGPVVITFTANDRAVGLAYPLASLIAGQNAAGLGDANDPFGGIGRNGAQHTPEAKAGTLGGVGTAYSFVARGLYNLNADAVIKDHSDVRGREVAYAILSAVAAT